MASTANPTGWPADAIERRPPGSLKPYARNARLHSEAQIAQLVASFDEFGFVSPVLVDEDGVLIAGHGRHAAALRLGLPEIPVMVARGWPEAKKRRFRLLDNKVAENSTWDADLVGLELGELRDEGEDILGLGFDQAELDGLLSLGLEPEREEGEGQPVTTGDQGAKGNLSARFGVPPFSVLNAREGWWQDRKRAWLALGIQSELGRGANALDMSASMAGITDPAAVEAWNEARRVAKANAVPGGAPMGIKGAGGMADQVANRKRGRPAKNRKADA